ncbi:MAG: hypothetical protein OEL83_05675 [Desulforhopalus sp.]|nr:hypothetical protein [Desulforhopalus sp.]
MNNGSCFGTTIDFIDKDRQRTFLLTVVKGEEEMQFGGNILVKILRERPLYFLDRQSFLRENRGVLLLALASLIVVLLIRSWENFSHPGFYAEDATYYFKLNYNADFLWENIFRNPNGYYNILNNFVAQLLGDIDIRWQAAAYQSVAFMTTVLTTLMFARSGLIKNKILIFLTPFILGLSGFNHIVYYLTITFQMYVLVLTLFAVLLLDETDSPIKNLMLFLIIPLLVWSGPYSVLAVPFAITFIVLFRGKTWIMLWTLVVTIAYALSTTGSTIMLGNIFEKQIQVLWGEAVIRDIFLLGLREHVNIEKVILLLAILVPAIYAIRRETFHLRILALFMVVIISSMAPVLLSKKIIMYGSIYPCHLLLGKFFWILSVLIIVDRLVKVIPEKFTQISVSAAACCIVLFIVVDNLKHESMRKIDVLYNIPEFLQTIHETEKLKLEEKGEIVRIIADGVGIFDPIVRVGSRNPEARLVKTIFIERKTNR